MSNSIETRSTSALFKRAEQLRRWQESDTNREPGEPKRSRLMPLMTPGGKVNSNLTSRSSKRGKRVQFTDGCVFLAACAAADKDEVKRLVERGADIDTANVDGLTALHQACIDDNLEMVEFLVERGSDVNRGDNEGWTPLHATASCGFLSIARYLIDQNANVSAVNNDGELAIDISESDEMELLLQKEIDKQGINCEDSRNTEERMMLQDAKQWVDKKNFGDVPHPKTEATALHVAAAKGYIKVISLLVQGGAPLNAQDLDGWTPLHAAAHWAQREACEILCENYANMEIKNYVGQTCFDVADPDVLRLLEELKKKQASAQKDRPDIRNLINRPAIPPGGTQSGGKRSIAVNNNHQANNLDNNINDNDRSSITRLSLDDKALRSKEVSNQERDLLLTKSGLVSETIPERGSHLASSESDRDSDIAKRNRANLDNVPRILTTPSKDDSSAGNKKTLENDEVHPWRRPASLRARPTSSPTSTAASIGSSINSKLSPNKDDDDIPLRRVHSFESDEKFYARLTELRNRIRATSMPALPGEGVANNNNANTQSAGTSNNNLGTSISAKKSDLPTHYSSLPRSNNHLRHLPSLPENSDLVTSSTASVTSIPTLTTTSATPPPLIRSISLKENVGQGQTNCQNAEESRSRSSSTSGVKPLLISDLLSQQNKAAAPSNNVETNEAERINNRKANSGLGLRNVTSSTPGPLSRFELWKKREDLSNRPKSDSTNLPQNIRRSFVPPVRDEESETQRKAHAKRVRETRRSTQGVTLEDLKSAEQLVKQKKAQQEQLQQLSQSVSGSGSVGSTASTTTNDDKATDRRPSWRMKAEGGDKNRFRLEDSRNYENDPGSGLGPGNGQTGLAALRKSSAAQNKSIPSISLTDDKGSSSNPAPSSPRPGSAAGSPAPASAQRRKKPKRRSTGVVNLGDLDHADDSEDSSEDDGVTPLKSLGAGGKVVTSGGASAPKTSSSSSGAAKSQNGADVDYKKLWEESQKENGRLRDEVDRVRSDYSHSKRQLETAAKQAVAVASSGGLNDTEKREKKALEKKLMEMEEELKQLEHLKNDNQRLRDENGALIRVISKLSK